MSGGGAAMAVWEDTTNKSVVSAYTAGLGATFGTPQTIELDATHPPALPAVAMNDNGDAQAVWANVLAQANGYDTGPQIPTLHVPTTPYAGHAVTLYAQGSDVWSPISTTTWNFGDGGTGNGPAVVHTYTAGSSGRSANTHGIRARVR